MSDQAAQLRELVRQTVRAHGSLRPGMPLVVVSGGKGGVGVTTIATELARQVARLGKRPVLVDANLLQPDIAINHNVQVDASLADVLAGRRSVVEVIGPLERGVRLVAGTRSPNVPLEIGPDAVSRLATELRSLGEKADLAIIDAGSGISPWVELLWNEAQQVMLVTIPEATAVMNAYANLKLARAGGFNAPTQLVLNCCPDVARAERIAGKFVDTCSDYLDMEIERAAPIVPRKSPHADEADAERLFRQSIQLLAADLVGTHLALHTRIARQHPQKESSEKLAKEIQPA